MISNDSINQLETANNVPFYPMLWLYGKYLYTKLSGGDLFDMNGMTKEFLENNYPNLDKQLKLKAQSYINRINDIMIQNNVFLYPKATEGQTTSSSNQNFHLSYCWESIFLIDNSIVVETNKTDKKPTSSYFLPDPLKALDPLLPQRSARRRTRSSTRFVRQREETIPVAPKKKDISEGTRAARTIGVLCFRLMKIISKEKCTHDILVKTTKFSRQRICTVLSIYHLVGLIYDDTVKETVVWNPTQEKILPDLNKFLTRYFKYRELKYKLINKLIIIMKNFSNKPSKSQPNNPQIEINKQKIMELILCKIIKIISINMDFSTLNTIKKIKILQKQILDEKISKFNLYFKMKKKQANSPRPSFNISNIDVNNNNHDYNISNLQKNMVSVNKLNNSHKKINHIPCDPNQFKLEPIKNDEKKNNSNQFKNFKIEKINTKLHVPKIQANILSGKELKEQNVKRGKNPNLSKIKNHISFQIPKSPKPLQPVKSLKPLQPLRSLQPLQQNHNFKNEENLLNRSQKIQSPKLVRNDVLQAALTMIKLSPQLVGESGRLTPVNNLTKSPLLTGGLNNININMNNNNNNNNNNNANNSKNNNNEINQIQNNNNSNNNKISMVGLSPMFGFSGRNNLGGIGSITPLQEKGASPMFQPALNFGISPSPLTLPSPISSFNLSPQILPYFSLDTNSNNIPPTTISSKNNTQNINIVNEKKNVKIKPPNWHQPGRLYRETYSTSFNLKKN
ncbi:nnp-1 protein putative nuclear protein 1 nop52 [Anaeramoeba flamelloides]|uniref:Nnp-1 protein putative nuclear protein 1 nop52 n=1 Tax=Anaeramoeba flamelloides TaxID=1746091 RepID=A0AAV7YX93_9EUKA|nr:nnp-1 protein putative nuclear protein 1 nop52 [Anaeramoeba flamelloides]